MLQIRPVVNCSPREAWYGEKEKVLLEQCSGKTAAESVIPYPPGIPVLYPGERITPALLEQLQYIRKAGIPLHGPADPELITLQTLK